MSSQEFFHDEVWESWVSAGFSSAGDPVTDDTVDLYASGYVAGAARTPAASYEVLEFGKVVWWWVASSADGTSLISVCDGGSVSVTSLVSSRCFTYV